MVPGELCVTHPGIAVMLQLCVDSLDICKKVMYSLVDVLVYALKYISQHRFSQQMLLHSIVLTLVLGLVLYT